MEIEKLQELKSGEEVTVITKGAYQLVDVAMGLRIPALTEVTMPLTPFVMDHLVLGNLTIVGEPDAPTALEGNEPINGVDGLRYEGARETEAARSAPTEDAFGGVDPAQQESRNFGVPTENQPKEAEEADAERDEVAQGARSGADGTSQSRKPRGK